MRDKPVRFGLKLWCLASSKSRYVYNLTVFLGKETGKGPNGLGYTVCTDFLRPFYHRGHILECDNFFSLPRLFHDLLVAGTWACGTVRSDRWCMPRNLKQEHDNVHRGRLIIRMHSIVKWHACHGGTPTWCSCSQLQQIPSPHIRGYCVAGKATLGNGKFHQAQSI